MVSINKKLLQMKAMYFLAFAGTSPLSAFGPTFAKQLGFSASSVGFVYFASVVLSIFGRIIFGYFADKFRMHKKLLFVTTLVCGFSVLSMALFRQRTKIETAEMVSGKAYISSENRTLFVICFANEGPLSSKQNLDGKVYAINCQDVNLTVSFADANSSLDSLHRKEDNSSCLEAVLENSSFRILDGNETEERRYYDAGTCSISPNTPDREQKSTMTDFFLPSFWLYLCLFSVFYVMSFIIGVFIDTICFHTLDNEEGNYGNQRMFASIGWGMAALLSGILTDYFSENDESKNYLPAFIVSFLLLVATATLTISFKMPKISNAAITDWGTVIKLLSNRISIIFSIWCFLIGVCSAVVWQYSFWVVENICNEKQRVWMKSLQGAMVVVNTFFGDVPTFYFFDRILERLGYVHCMTVTLLLNAIRLFAYSILTNPVWGLLIAILDGFSFGLGYATITSYADLISTPETKAIIQAIFNSIFDGLGTSLGSLCFGFVSDWYGCSQAFHICSFLAIGGACLHIIIRLHWNKIKVILHH